MTPDIEKKYQRLRSFFFGLCILAAGFLFLATAKNVITSIAAESWQVQPGILAGGGQSNQRLSGLYGASLLRYTYEIDGKKYEGTRIGYGISSITDVQSLNGSVRVYVNPGDYTDSVLITGFKRAHMIALIFSAGFLWLGFYLWRRTA